MQSTIYVHRGKEKENEKEKEYAVSHMRSEVLEFIIPSVAIATRGAFERRKFEKNENADFLDGTHRTECLKYVAETEVKMVCKKNAMQTGQMAKARETEPTTE